MAKTEVTPQLRQRAKNMHDSGLKYKEIAAELKLASEKVAWHLVNTVPKDGGKAHGKASAKASGKASRTPKASGKAKPQPKAQKASGTPKASPRTPSKREARAVAKDVSKAFRKASQGDTARAQAEASTTTSAPANRLNMVEPAGGGRPVAYPPEVRSVPKPKDRKK